MISLRFDPIIRAIHTVAPKVIRCQEVSGKELANLDAIPEASEIPCSFVEPIGIRPTSAATGMANDMNGRLELLRVGFTVNVPEGCGVHWVRFTVEVVNADDGAIVLTGIVPARIRRPFDLIGPIKIGEDGTITRKKSKIYSSGIPHASFLPAGKGFLPGPNIACWDFLPEEKAISSGTSNLCIALRRNGKTALNTRQSLMIRLMHPSFGELILSEPQVVIPIRYVNG